MAQLLVSGLALGSVYALVALGFVVIYRASQTFNFAQGELLAFGAFLMITLTGTGLPWGAAAAGAMLGTGLLGLAIERGLLRAFVGRQATVSVIVTIFIAAALRVMLVLIWGTDSRGMPTPWDATASIEVAGANVLINSVAAIVAAAVVVAGFQWLVRRSKLGVAMRATSSDQEASLTLGIPVGVIFGLAWFIAGVFAAVGGIFLGMFPRSVDSNIGLIALRAFPAVIVGGLDSVAGAIIAGVMLGVLEVLTQGYVNPVLGAFGQNFHSVLPYLVMVVFLVVRPYGIFGRPEVKRA